MTRSDNFNVVLIGAGGVIFGTEGGPWNHSARLEQKLGTRLQVVAVIDPDTARASGEIKKKLGTSVAPAYENTRIYKSLEEYLQTVKPNEAPHAVFVGCPPKFRGSTKPGRNVEIQLIENLPGVPFFVEKPVATGTLEEVQDAIQVGEAIKKSGVLCAAGYMLRYLKAVQMMKSIIVENKLTVMATVARYACAYTSIPGPFWWDKSKSGGPIIEQATHVCDLSRYFGGEVDTTSVTAHSLEWDEDAGKLSKIAFDEAEKIKPEDRIPRVTSACWKYKSGAVGTLVHLVSLQGTDYSCDLEVFADGYTLRLVNPYVLPCLYIRRPGSDVEESYKFGEDDPFFSEVSSFVDSIEGEGPQHGSLPVLSSFEDAVKTYQLSWAIREFSENSVKEWRSKAADKGV